MYFRDEYWFLSNFYPCSIKTSVGTFTCVESAFQSQKDLTRSKEFISLNGKQAKALGRRVTLRDDWQDIKLELMYKIVKAKFVQHPDLAEKLIAIKSPIVETNYWKDCYWGVCYGVGENHLGKILMRVRDELSKDTNLNK